MKLSAVNCLMMGLLIASTVAGCATKGSQTISRDSEYQRMLDMQRAKAEYYANEDKARDIPPATWQTYERLGDQYAKQGNDMMAYVQYNKALQMDPNQLGLRYRLGHLYATRGMPDEAIREFNQILVKEPNSALAYQGLALATMAKGELAQAKDHLSKAIALDPKLWQAHAYLGMAYDREKAFDKAADEYRQAIGINPKSAALYNNLGLSCYLMDDYAKSVEASLPPSGSTRKIPGSITTWAWSFLRSGATRRHLKHSRRARTRPALTTIWDTPTWRHRSTLRR